MGDVGPGSSRQTSKSSKKGGGTSADPYYVPWRPFISDIRRRPSLPRHPSHVAPLLHAFGSQPPTRGKLFWPHLQLHRARPYPSLDAPAAALAGRWRLASSAKPGSIPPSITPRLAASTLLILAVKSLCQMPVEFDWYFDQTRWFVLPLRYEFWCIDLN